MNKGGDHQAGGFTIVETLIVLAVTGTLFFSAITLVSGRQNKTQFQTAMNNVTQKIQQTINETQSGYYGNPEDIQCEVTGSTPKIKAGAATNSKGQCQFLGKVLQFGDNQTNSVINVYPIMGKLNSTSAIGGGSAKTLAEATPVAIARTGVDSSPSEIDRIDTIPLENGLEFKTLNGNNQYSAVGILAGDASGAFIAGIESGSSYDSGSLSITPRVIAEPLFGGTTQAMASAIQNNDYTQRVSGNIELCFQSGSTDQSGLVTITPSAAVSLKIFQNISCLNS